MRDFVNSGPVRPAYGLGQHPLPKPYVIVVGNEKGGSGKSTTAMHIAVALMKCGFEVGTIDLDSRQGTFSAMMDNRQSFSLENELDIPIPRHHRIFPAGGSMTVDGLVPENERRVGEALKELSDCDFVIVDTPGTDSPLSRAGHSMAHTLITPINDSFVDLDVLAKVDHEGSRMLEPSIYSQMIWDLQEKRSKAGKPAIDWLVMRNRLSRLNSQNNETITNLFRSLRRQVGFREAPGFSERVIFRELFPKGLTLLDLRDPGVGVEMNISHVHAREEVRQLLQTMGLRDVADKIGGRPEKSSFIVEKLRPKSMEVIRIASDGGEKYRQQQAGRFDLDGADAYGDDVEEAWARPGYTHDDLDALRAEAAGRWRSEAEAEVADEEDAPRGRKRGTRAGRESDRSEKSHRASGALWGSLAALILLTVSIGVIVEANYPGGVRALGQDMTGSSEIEGEPLNGLGHQVAALLDKLRQLTQ
ncbi:MAG: division plane positioning ATPase MipZ [Rhodovibrionaceae bacterium]|nr:division plane positioning ATPase MipZ [Rhodovibrionaceae bacterium]